MLFNGMGGGGAAKDADGWPMIGTIAGMGGLTSGSTEETELLYPLRIEFHQRKRKTEQPPARISLSWLRPHAVEQIVPRLRRQVD